MIRESLSFGGQAGMQLEQRHRDFLAECNAFNIEGRYLELFLPLPSYSEANTYIDDIKELMKCLNQMF